MYPQILEKAESRGLPLELVNILSNAQGSAYLEAIATASFDPQFTDLLLPLYHPIAAEISQRWLQNAQDGTPNQEATAISCFARILPFATYLKPKIKNFLRNSLVTQGVTTNLPSATAPDDGRLQTLLLAFFRLLSHDLDAFTDLVKPVFLCSLFSHESLPVRFLAIECFCQVMRFADALNQDLICKYVGSDQVLGLWEGIQIDFRLVKLHEERRWLELQENLKASIDNPKLSLDPLLYRFSTSDLSSETACIAGVLVPRDDGVTVSTQSTFVMTETATANMRAVAKTLHHSKSILLSGPSGAGKTAIIYEVARQVNKLSDLVTLHLNDQTDAKSLLGIYTSSASGNAFTWQPGVLTKAVQEGRWVLIEDIDRASVEVNGLLRPLIENNKLFLPSRKECLRPKDGFRIIGTIRTTNYTRSSSAGRQAFLSNRRLWSMISIVEYPEAEIRQLLQARFEGLTPFLDTIMASHSRIAKTYACNPAFKAAQARIPSIRDLLKWCRRLSARLELRQTAASATVVPETFMVDMLKDSIDCYALYLNDNRLVHTIGADVAEVINISPVAFDHAIKTQNPIVQHDKRALQVGRSSLVRLNSKGVKNPSSSAFALTRRVRQIMEAVVSAVAAEEPLLLVGETGVGKTTIVQHIASSVGQNLTAVNLSNQSEASDLLGGLKPVTTRSLVVPLVDEFNSLFDETFSANKNEKFQQSISRAFAKQRWPRLVGHWEEAVQLALRTLSNGTKRDQSQEQATKRRRLDMPKYQVLREQWAAFANSLNQVKSQIQRGEQHQVFAFVESRLVQAVRNGTWLLLDEINLASPETLDSIISLFRDGEDNAPYLLLAEAGNIERIQAHPNFRLFAAMNPATDTGKKDLPPAIRSYFTELFVHSGDDNVNDLTEIVQVYLSPILDNDRRAAKDLARAYLALKELSTQHKLTDGAGDLPHFSLRSLTRCLQYVQRHAPSHGLRRAMHEGMQMSFLTVLSQKSQQIALSVIEQHLLNSSLTRRNTSTQKLKITLDATQYVTLQHHLLLKGSEQPDDQSHYVRTASVERNLVNIARAASMRRFPILLQGPTSAGKTSMIEYLAKYSGNKFVRINNHEHTDLQEYLGSYTSGADGKLEYREGVLVEALRKGYWIVLDELNLAPSDVLEALNRLLDDNRELLIPESQEIVRPHPNFMLFATQNPAGLYGGRKRLSRAFRNRFLEIHVDDIPEDELEIILKERAQIAPSFCRQIVEVYKKLSLQRQSSRLFEQRNSFATLRDLFRWASRPVNDREQLAYHGYMLLAERVREPAEKAVVKSTIEDTLKVKINDDELYKARNLPLSVISAGGITWTRAMRRLFVLVSNALRNNEPVLLVGETGCGKTQVCQIIAQAFEKHLNIYNAHSNTETGDLIGSQRPVRHKSELAEALVQSLQSLGKPYAVKHSNDNVGIEELICQFKNMDTSTFDKQAIDKVNSSIAAYQSLFAWNDGSLVRAMKDGSHFLLDEISLADDSVLERMNSLLEPGRTILLAEKGVKDNFVVAAPGFQFLATMNPGGDYGKRELSAALRNRLTEIWVPPLSNDEDVLPILQTRLGTFEPRIASIMLDFAHYFTSEITVSNNSAIPLRTLLSWADFVTRNVVLGVETAMVHGAAMTYIDSLGANPAGMTTNSIKDIRHDREKCLTKLSELLGIDAAAVYTTRPALEMTQSHVHIGCFSIQRSARAAGEDELVLDAPTTLKNAMRIVRALQTSRPLLLEGNPGVGKTAIVSSLAKICGRILTRINLSDQTDLMDLFGADAPVENAKLGQFSWRDGPLLKAMQNGGWVLLDEMNLASQSVLEGLNACLDHRQEVYIAELDKTFKCHPGFTLFATQNPHHQGGGRKGLPASFVNRFTVVYADPFQQEDLIQICKLRFPSIPEHHVSNVVSTIDQSQALVAQRHEFSDGGPWELNLRDLTRWFSLCEYRNTLHPMEHFDSIVAQRFRSEAARMQAIDLSKSILGSAEEISLYHQLSSNQLQVGTAFMDRDYAHQPVHEHFALTTSHLRYAKSVVTALTQGWPVILAGESGSGKTTLIRSLAAFSGAKLVELSMNTDVDTADLIGGYEQYDVQREIASVMHELKTLLATVIGQKLHQGQSSGLDVLIDVLGQINVSDIDLPGLVSSLAPMVEQVLGLQDFLDKLTTLHDNAITESSSFVWNDGILVDALQAGSWIVLDNANLCNASVLDRLNSLLEPNGCLIVSEQHGIDGEGRILRPHPKSRIILTMDPRFGELSRAMRNRSLEIFMDAQFPQSADAPLPAYPTTSSISRLRSCSFATSGLTLKTTQELEPWMSRLAPQDLSLGAAHILPLHANVSQQLVLEEASLQGSSERLKDMRSRILDESNSTAPGLRQLLDDQTQPFVLLVNEPRLRVLLTPDAVEDVALHTQLQFLLTALVRCQYHIADQAQQVRNVPWESLSVLQRSTPTILNRVRRSEKQPIRAFEFAGKFAEFCSDLFHPTRRLLCKKTYSTIRDLIMLLLDITSLFDQRSVSSDHVQAFVQIAFKLYPQLEALSLEFPQSFYTNVIQLLQNSCILKTGYGLQTMWPTWKGSSVETAHQLQAQIAMEQLINRFDQLCKQLPYPRAHLADVRLKLLEANATVVLSQDAMAQIQILTTAIDEMAKQQLSELDMEGHFAPVFDNILAKFRLQNIKIPAKDMQKMVLFGTSRSIPNSLLETPVGSPAEVLERLSAIVPTSDGDRDISAAAPGELRKEMIMR
ncbi:AAA ATPase midasin, partial [Neophaeococcomyces mojaviensis]